MAAMVEALAMTNSGVSVMYDCHTKLALDQSANTVSMMFKATSNLGLRKRNEPNKRLYDRDFDQALVDDREVALRSRVSVWESGAAGIAA